MTAKEALRHPTYSMGAKISIDSATMMNKGLEVIEAHYLFKMPGGKIEVAVHPQSIVHSMVEFIDGAIMAQLSPPDMALPIQYALTYPQRAPSVGAVWDVKGRLDFFAPDLKKFPCLALAYEALSIGKSAPCYLNGANEVLVARFLQGKIAYLDIANKLEKLLALHRSYDMLSLQSVLEVDKQAREAAQHV